MQERRISADGERLALFQGAARDDGVVTISRGVFNGFQFALVTLFVALGAFHYAYGFLVGEDFIFEVTKFLDVDRENSLPTAFAALNTLIGAVLAFAIYRHERYRADRFAVYWLALSCLCFAMSLEEVAGLHERFSNLQDYTGVIVPLVETHSWMLYGAPIAILIGLLFVPFLRQLDRDVTGKFLLAGAVYLAGALGMEFLGAWYLHATSGVREDPIYTFRFIFEEGFEMSGIAILNCALFSYAIAHRVTLALRAAP